MEQVAFLANLAVDIANLPRRFEMIGTGRAVILPRQAALAAAVVDFARAEHHTHGAVPLSRSTEPISKAQIIDVIGSVDVVQRAFAEAALAYQQRLAGSVGNLLKAK